MTKIRRVSTQTRNNWLVDAALFLGALVSSITGIYFLYLPVGGYQGGRNPFYGVTILFQRESWDDLHTWFGILMIVAAGIHIVLHWKWIVKMTSRTFQELSFMKRSFNSRGRFNVGVNMVTGLSFLITAISGIYFLFSPGGRHGAVDPRFIFTRATWDMIHTWAGIVMVDTAVIHFIIHWGWIVKVTRKLVLHRKPVLVSKTVDKPIKTSLT